MQIGTQKNCCRHSNRNANSKRPTLHQKPGTQAPCCYTLSLEIPSSRCTRAANESPFPHLAYTVHTGSYPLTRTDWIQKTFLSAGTCEHERGISRGRTKTALGKVSSMFATSAGTTILHSEFCSAARLDLQLLRNSICRKTTAKVSGSE